MNNKVKVPTKKFVSPEKKTEFMMKDHMSQYPTQHVSPHKKRQQEIILKVSPLWKIWSYKTFFSIDCMNILSLIVNLGPVEGKGRKLKLRKCGNPRNCHLSY